MELRLGFFSGAVRDWKAERVAPAAAEAGFGGIEWELNTGDGHIRLEASSADGLVRREESERAGLFVCCVSAAHTVSILDHDNVDSLVEACVASGSRFARMFAPPFDRSRDLDEQLGSLRGALARHVKKYGDHGVTLVLELSEETIVPSPELLRRVCDGLDARAVGVLYDPANMLVEGNLAPPLALRVLGPYLHHVHMKNETFVRAENGSWQPRIVPADEGIVEWPSVFAELRGSGYSGWIVIDHLSGDATAERMTAERRVAEDLWGRSLAG